MITVHALYQGRFREIASRAGEDFALERPRVRELAEKLVAKYGPAMAALLLDEGGRELNARGTLYLDSRSRRVHLDDELSDGETIAFMVGVAGG